MANLKSVLNDIEHILEEYQEGSESVKKMASLTDSQFYEALQKFRKMILELDTQALDEAEILYQEFIERGLQDDINQIIQFLNDFDFEKAENVLHIVLSKKKKR